MGISAYDNKPVRDILGGESKMAKFVELVYIHRQTQATFPGWHPYSHTYPA